jgi:hypothetical protein
MKCAHSSGLTSPKRDLTRVDVLSGRWWRGQNSEEAGAGLAHQGVRVAAARCFCCARTRTCSGRARVELESRRVGRTFTRSLCKTSNSPNRTAKSVATPSASLPGAVSRCRVGENVPFCFLWAATPRNRHAGSAPCRFAPGASRQRTRRHPPDTPKPSAQRPAANAGPRLNRSYTAGSSTTTAGTHVPPQGNFPLPT